VRPISYRPRPHHPRAAYGPDVPWNRQLLCWPCNLRKGDRCPARYAADFRPEPFRSQLTDISAMQIDADMSADGRWLSYDQLAALCRIDIAVGGKSSPRATGSVARPTPDK
jgi:hypothetical protein